MRAAIAEWADGRYEAERFVDDDGVDLNKPVRIHVIAEKKGDRLHFDFTRLGRPDQGPGQYPSAAGAGGLRLLPDLDDRPAHVCIERAAQCVHHRRARGQRAEPALPGAGQHLQSDHPRAGRRGLRRAVAHRAGQDPRRRRRLALDHHWRTHHHDRQGLRAVRDHRRRRRRAPDQGRHVGHLRQPEQRQDRAGRDHRERIPDPHAALRADPRFRRPGTFPRRARHPPRVPQSRRRALFDPLDQARRAAERLCGRRIRAASATF